LEDEYEKPTLNELRQRAVSAIARGRYPNLEAEAILAALKQHKRLESSPEPHWPWAIVKRIDEFRKNETAGEEVSVTDELVDEVVKLENDADRLVEEQQRAIEWKDQQKASQLITQSIANNQMLVSIMGGICREAADSLPLPKKSADNTRPALNIRRGQRKHPNTVAILSLWDEGKRNREEIRRKFVAQLPRAKKDRSSEEEEELFKKSWANACKHRPEMRALAQSE
jgi:hypothetical protein